MIYKDKEYKEVLDGSAEVGDLVHVVKLDNVPLDFYALITRFDTEGDKRLDSLLPDNTDFLIDDDDTDFKVYRYVEDVKEDVLTEDNVEVNDHFVIIDDTSCHGVSNGNLVQRNEGVLGYAGMSVTVLETGVNRFVNYTDVRRATEDEISGTTKTKVEEVQGANDIYTELMTELGLIANSKEDQQKLLNDRIQEIKEEQEQLKQRNDQLDTVRRVLEAL